MPPRKRESRVPAWLVLAGLVLLFLAVRAPGLGRYATIDEVFWLNKSADFWNSLSKGEWGSTGLAGHPGITTAWAGLIGIRLEFPDFLDQAPTAITDFHLRNLFRQQGHNPIAVLASARQVMVALNAAVFALLFICLRKLIGLWPAGMAAGLLALDPFLSAHQRLLHQDGLMAGLAVLSLLAFAVFLNGKDWRFAALSGAAAGLAWLTKSPTLVLAPCIGLLALWQWRAGNGGNMLRGLGIWTLAAALIFVTLWPKMWVLPGEALAEIWHYATASAGGEFNGPIFFNGQIYPNGELGPASAYFYPFTLWWRATPIDLLGLALAGWFLVRSADRRPGERGGLIGLLGFGLLFTLAMSIAGKKFDRYMLPAYAALLPVAGWGLATGLRVWGGRWRAWVQPALAAGLLVAQAASAAGTYPYFLTYYNPLAGGLSGARQVMMLGWGEGLEQAAVYLNQQPGIENRRVAAWYSNAFNLFFSYEAGDIPIASELSETALQDLLGYDYLVIYVHEWQRGTPQNLLDALAGLEPEWEFAVNGVEYVRIYKLR